MNKVLKCAIIGLITSCCNYAMADVKYLSNYDGDTIKIMDNQELLTIRLSQVDAQELKQPFGKYAKNAVKDLCENTNIEYHQTGQVSYNRIVGRVLCNNIDLGQLILINGFGRLDERYTPMNSDYWAFQNAAKKEKRGIWSGEYYSPKECRVNKMTCGVK